MTAATVWKLVPAIVPDPFDNVSYLHTASLRSQMASAFSIVPLIAAENPKEYSKSYKCPDYKPKYEAQAVKNLKLAA
jgi:hypothetical protein